MQEWVPLRFGRVLRFMAQVLGRLRVEHGAALITVMLSSLSNPSRAVTPGCNAAACRGSGHNGDSDAS